MARLAEASYHLILCLWLLSCSIQTPTDDDDDDAMEENELRSPADSALMGGCLELLLQSCLSLLTWDGWKRGENQDLLMTILKVTVRKLRPDITEDLVSHQDGLRFGSSAR